jgi:hypothetical protein
MWTLVVAKEQVMTRVVNRRTERAAETVYIGRGSPWGNPFSHKPSSFDVVVVPTVAEAIERYREWLIDRLYREPGLREELLRLDGQVLGCYCKPGPCHGDVLVALIEAEKGARR